LSKAITKIAANLQAFGQRLWAATRRMKGRMDGKLKDCVSRIKVYVRR